MDSFLKMQQYFYSPIIPLRPSTHVGDPYQIIPKEPFSIHTQGNVPKRPENGPSLKKQAVTCPEEIAMTWKCEGVIQLRFNADNLMFGKFAIFFHNRLMLRDQRMI